MMMLFFGLPWSVGGVFIALVYLTFSTITLEMKVAYKWKQAGGLMPELNEAAEAYAEAQHSVDEAKVWFWSLREPHRTLVEERQAIVDEWVIDLEKAKRWRDKRLKLAAAYDDIQHGRNTMQRNILGALVVFTVASPFISLILMPDRWSVMLSYVFAL
ncbi:hypothetical protein PHYBOEH_002612 [Phytophthora boehmeriae]|uniref:Uncharacterized protein n=1 Tax=Phytophthora boehmeriae TaxID=109152 RepID=A0A8T1WQE5_9STRA|nr:hypothetical protein PHYBOEH_002612 [Phytophthora boehmeriae]